MPNYKIEVPRIRDSDLVRFFFEIARLIGANQINATILGGARSETIGSAEWDTHYLAKSELYTIQNVNVGSSGYSMTLTRGVGEAGDYTFDRLSIDNSSTQGNNNPRIDGEVAHLVSGAISRTFLSSPDLTSPLFHSSKSFETLMKSHQRMIEQLQKATTSVGEQVAAARLRLEEEYAERNSELDAEYKTRQTELEKTAEEGKRLLANRENELEERRKELDDRDNTHARRDLHKTLKARIAERAGKFQITPETKKARTPVHVASWISILILGVLLYYYTTELTSLATNAPTTIAIATAIKPIGITVAFLGLIAWYLRWMNRWFERYADAEFYLKQFELDIDRANWVVETALEWKEAQGKAIPDPLLEGISRNLFSKSEKDEDANLHPADYLASAILGRASAVNLKVPGGEISLDNRGIRKLQKDETTA